MRQKRRPLSQFSDFVSPKAPKMRRHVHSACGRNDDPFRNSEPSGLPSTQKSVDVHFPRQKPCKLIKSSIRQKHVFFEGFRHHQNVAKTQRIICFADKNMYNVDYHMRAEMGQNVCSRWLTVRLQVRCSHRASNVLPFY